MKNSKLCQYCDPVPNYSGHILERFEKLWQLPAKNRNRIRKNALLTWVSPRVFQTFTSVGLHTTVLKQSKLLSNLQDNRIKLLLGAAKKKNIKLQMIRVFGRPSTLFIAKKGNQTIRFELLPTWPVGQRMPINIDEKPVFKTLLQKQYIKVPAGRVFSRASSAIAYVQTTLKYPVVVKPANGSLSMHVTSNIQNEAELRQAIRIAKIVSRNFVVERYLSGNVYRLLCLDGHLVAAGLRKPPEVVGDGKHTIRQLLAIKNRKRKSTGLRAIPITVGLHQTLENQKYKITDIPPKGRKILLFNKVILAAGAEVAGVTAEVHPQFQKLAEKAARLIDLPVIGFDIIAKDISQPANKQEYGFIEANSMPYFDMHKSAEKIAEQIWEIVFKEKSS